MQLMLWNLGWLVLAASWLGPLPEWAETSFAAHMTLHMSVVAIAAPFDCSRYIWKAIRSSATIPQAVLAYCCIDW